MGLQNIFPPWLITLTLYRLFYSSFTLIMSDSHPSKLSALGGLACLHINLALVDFQELSWSWKKPTACPFFFSPNRLWIAAMAQCWCKGAMVICNTGDPLAPTCIVSQPPYISLLPSSSCSIAHRSYSITGSPIPPGLNYEKQAALQFSRDIKCVWVLVHWHIDA